MNYDIDVNDMIHFFEEQGCVITEAEEGNGGFFVDGKPLDLAEAFQEGAFENDACKYCSNNPKNGGDGFCHCTLGQRTVY